MHVERDVTRVGLVLGAGGATGAAFHAGTLLAIEQDLGWCPGSADIVVGSSAGSIVGALIRAGMSTEDLAAWGSSVPPSSAGRYLRLVVDEMQSMSPRRRLSPLQCQRPNIYMLRRFLNPYDRHRHTIAVSLIPHGVVDMAPVMRTMGRVVRRWPSEPLWIPAVRTRDGRRVVFGRDLRVPLGDALAASCAIPGIFRPVAIGKSTYVDGAVHSPTNADLLDRSGLDVVIVLSPMSGSRSAHGHGPNQLLRAACAARLARERQSLERSGTAVVVIEPDASTLEAMGGNPLDDGRTGAVVTQAFLSAAAQYTADLKRLLRNPGTVEPGRAKTGDRTQATTPRAAS
jgi:NTE family protein